MAKIHITKVLTRNFMADFVSRFQNLIGSNLTYYERMINKGIDDIENEISLSDVKIKWYRYEISQLTNGAMVIIFYGETI